MPGQSLIGRVATFESSSVTCPEKPGSMKPAVEWVSRPRRPSELLPSSRAAMTDDPARVAAFRGWVAVQNAAEVSVTGLPEILWTPEEQLPYLLDPEAPSRLVAVHSSDGTVVAAGVYDTKQAPGTPNCWMWLGVAPDHRRRGVGTLLAD